MGSVERRGQMVSVGRGALKLQRSKSKLSLVSKALKYGPKEVEFFRAIRPRARASDSSAGLIKTLQDHISYSTGLITSDV